MAERAKDPVCGMEVEKDTAQGPVEHMGRMILRQTAYERDGVYYCCPDCFEGKTCDCQ